MNAPAADQLDWTKVGGLLPAIVQHALTGQVLMLAYMNRESFDETVACGEAVFFSRSRDRLWRKGESSGHVLKVTEIRKDCDADTLLVRALPAGPTCHRGTRSCFGDAVPATVLEDIEGVIASRLVEHPDGSYVAKLAAAGQLRVAQKLGEEGVETVLAAVAGNDDALVAESADLLFHLLVLLQFRGLSLEAVLEQLAARRR